MIAFSTPSSELLHAIQHRIDTQVAMQGFEAAASLMALLIGYLQWSLARLEQAFIHNLAT